MFLTHSRPILRQPSTANIHQINLYQHTNFMYTFKKTLMSEYLIVEVFKNSFEKKKKKIEFNRFSLISTKYSISVRVPKI